MQVISEFCDCGDGISNSGYVNCAGKRGKVKRFVAVETTAADGTDNSISCNDFVDGVLPQAYIEDKINEADKTKRWYVSGDLENVTYDRADPVTETIGNATKVVEKGRKLFKGFFTEKGTSVAGYLKFLKSLECPSLSLFIIDEYGNLVGEVKADGNLHPFKIEDDTVWSRSIEKTDATGGKNEFNYTLDQSVIEANTKLVKASALGVNLLTQRGLLDVVLAEDPDNPNTATSIFVIATLIYGAYCDPLPFSAGVELTDWDVYNVTGAAALPLTAVIQDTNDKSKYELQFASTPSSTLEVEVDKAGFESNELTTTTP